MAIHEMKAPSQFHLKSFSIALVGPSRPLEDQSRWPVDSRMGTSNRNRTLGVMANHHFDAPRVTHPQLSNQPILLVVFQNRFRTEPVVLEMLSPVGR